MPSYCIAVWKATNARTHSRDVQVAAQSGGHSALTGRSSCQLTGTQSRLVVAHQPNRGTRPPQQPANNIPRLHWPTSTTAPAASGAVQLTSAASALFGPVAIWVFIAPPRSALSNDSRLLVRGGKCGIGSDK